MLNPDLDENIETIPMMIDLPFESRSIQSRCVGRAMPVHPLNYLKFLPHPLTTFQARWVKRCCDKSTMVKVYITSGQIFEPTLKNE